MKTRVLLPILLILSLPIMSSCWDQRQLSDMALVLGLAIDLAETESGESQMLLTVEIADISDNPTAATAKVFSAQGPTIMAAIGNLAQTVDKYLHWGHMQSLIISSDAASQGLDQYINIFFNDHEMSPLIYIFISEGAAKDVLDGQLGLSRYLAGGLRTLIGKKTNISNGYISGISIHRYMEDSNMENCGLLLPLVSEYKEPQLVTGGLTNDPHDDDQKTAYYLRGMAIIDEDNNYSGYLQGNENLGALMINGRVNDFELILYDPKNKITISLAVNDWQLQKDWQIDRQTEQLKLNLQGKAATILNEEQKYLNYYQPEQRQYLQDLAAAELERIMLLAFKQAQDLENDFLLLGRDLWRYHYQDWQQIKEQWPKAMANIDLSFDLDVKVEFSGQGN